MRHSDLKGIHTNEEPSSTAPPPIRTCPEVHLHFSLTAPTGHCYICSLALNPPSMLLLLINSLLQVQSVVDGQQLGYYPYNGYYDVASSWNNYYAQQQQQQPQPQPQYYYVPHQPRYATENAINPQIITESTLESTKITRPAVPHPPQPTPVSPSVSPPQAIIIHANIPSQNYRDEEIAILASIDEPSETKGRDLPVPREVIKIYPVETQKPSASRTIVDGQVHSHVVVSTTTGHTKSQYYRTSQENAYKYTRTTYRTINVASTTSAPRVVTAERRVTQTPSAPTSSSVRPPLAKSFLSEAKVNEAFLECCKQKKVDPKCESRCNFDVLGKKVLTGMFLGSDPCPQTYGRDLMSCAAQDKDHTECCRSKGVADTTAGQKCLLFCQLTPGSNFQADVSMLPCWGVLKDIKQCFKESLIAQL